MEFFKLSENINLFRMTMQQSLQEVEYKNQRMIIQYFCIVIRIDRVVVEALT